MSDMKNIFVVLHCLLLRIAKLTPVGKAFCFKGCHILQKMQGMFQNSIETIINSFC